mgnify:FL=1
MATKIGIERNDLHTQERKLLAYMHFLFAKFKQTDIAVKFKIK